MSIEIREMKSHESLSVPLWKEALARVDELARTADNVLFVARDQGSLFGLRRRHGGSGRSGFTAIAPDKARIFYDLGMKFRFAFLINPSDEIVAGITPLVTEQLTIAHRIPKPRKGTLPCIE